MMALKRFLPEISTVAILLLCFSFTAPVFAEPIRIGVLAKRGRLQTLERWAPTAQYLTEELPGLEFEIAPLSFEGLHQAVILRGIDFLITNSSYYVLLESAHGLKRVATMINLHGEIPQKEFGGVVLTRADRADINGFSDLYGKTFWAVDEDSLGGWLAAWREFNAVGLNPERDFKALRFSGTHDSVVLAVKRGLADAGTVRTDTLETMAEEGTIALADFKILNLQSQLPTFNYLLSTRLYPEWPFAVLPHVDGGLAQQVAEALLRMEKESGAARSAHIAGWSPPYDYQPVYDLLRERHLKLYRTFIGKASILNFVREHWPFTLLVVVLLILLVLILGYTVTLNRRLEKRVWERTRALVRETAERKATQERLQRAEKMEAIGLMASGVAHDLNNILSGIVNYPELMLRKLPQDSSLRRPVTVIRDSGLRAADVVDDLLTLARGAAKVRNRLDVNLLVHDYLGSPEVEKVRSLFPQVAISERLAAGRIEVECAPTHVKKSLMNLVLNAAEAVAADGRITIATKLRRLTEESSRELGLAVGTYVLLSVTDNGSGISPEDRKHIFEPFYTKKKMGRSGTGIGLAVVWNCMREHNGTVTVSSSGRGSEFTLYFPVAAQAVPAPMPDSLADTGLSQEELRGNGQRVLVVDDESQQREIATELLTELGYRAEAVSSGEKAVAYLEEKPVDLLLLDMVMDSGIDGLETYQRARKIYPGQKALLVSGYSESDKVKEALALGVKRLLKKPYRIDDLARTLNEILTG